MNGSIATTPQSVWLELVVRDMLYEIRPAGEGPEPKSDAGYAWYGRKGRVHCIYFIMRGVPCVVIGEISSNVLVSCLTAYMAPGVPDFSWAKAMAIKTLQKKYEATGGVVLLSPWRHRGRLICFSPDEQERVRYTLAVRRERDPLGYHILP